MVVLDETSAMEVASGAKPVQVSSKSKPVKRTMKAVEGDEDEEDVAVNPKQIRIAQAMEKAQDELRQCQEVLQNKSLSLNSRLDSASLYFESLFVNNVNTALLPGDFPLWVKTVIGDLAGGRELESTSKELYKFLIWTLKIAPTAFEPVAEKILKVCIFNKRIGKECRIAYEEFMIKLVETFERLRRFPKLIAKILCCSRDYFLEQEELKVKESQLAVQKLLPIKFLTSLGPVVNLLPIGQVIDLWKTFHHNFEAECVKRILVVEDVKNSKLHWFLAFTTELFVEFISNAKIVDFTVPASTISKVAEMMKKFKDDCLQPLGMYLKDSKPLNLEIFKPFLKLGLTWAEIHGVLLNYNQHYAVEMGPVVDNDHTSDALDLSFLHSYMKSEDWIQIGNVVMRETDKVASNLLVNLVAQKLRYTASLNETCSTMSITGFSVSVTQTQPSAGDTEPHRRQCPKSEQLKIAAEFLWTHQESIDPSCLDETLSLLIRFISLENMIELAGNCVKKLEPSSEKDSNFILLREIGNPLETLHGSLVIASESPLFHYALVIEALAEVIRRIGKMKLLSKSIKNVLTNILSPSNRLDFLKSVSEKMMNERKEVMVNLLAAVNEIVENKSTSITLDDTLVGADKKTEEFSIELIDGMLRFLGSLELENYPKNMKTFVFQCAVVILLAVMEQDKDREILDFVARMVINCGSQSHGNEILFGIQWVDVFKVFRSESTRFCSIVQKQLFNMILTNIYVSPKSITHFEEKELNFLCESFELTKPPDHVALIILEFLIKELQGPKQKSTPQIKSHAKKLIYFFSKWFENSSARDDIDSNSRSESVSLKYRANWLLISAVNIVDRDGLSKLQSIVSSNTSSALKFIKSYKFEDETLTAESNQSLIFSLQFLHVVCTLFPKECVSSNYFKKLWKAYLNMQTRIFEKSESSGVELEGLIPHHFVKDLYEKSSVEDFNEISLSVSFLAEKYETAEDAGPGLRLIIHLLGELIDAELEAGKKQFRRKTVEQCLNSLLGSSLLWKTDDKYLNRIVFPYLQFQTKLIRRRGAMVNLPSLAVCLTSVTSVPLNGIKDATMYKKLFCCTAELVNAFAIHRLDVLSFRTHVYLQCFTFLIHSLTKRANQENKLTDGEIFDLRHCAHSMERICQSMKLGQKEFSRVSPYFVAVLMRQFEIFTVYPAVKAPLLNGSYKLLDLCDEHGISQLNSMLTIGSREVFKTVYELYKKYYKYKGKV